MKADLKYWVALLLGLCVFGGTTGHAQERFFSSYTVENGLPYSGLKDVFQSENGYLWICTNGGGVARYDGHSFRYFNAKSGLPSNVANVGLEDANGRIWIGTNGGLVCIERDSLSVFGKKDGLPGLNVQALDWFNDQLFVGTDSGLCSITPTGNVQIHQQPLIRGLEVISLLHDEEHRLWIGTNGAGLYYLHQGQVAVHSVSTYAATIHCLASGSDESVLVGTEAGLFSVAESGKDYIPSSFQTYDLDGVRVRSILVAGDESLWLGTNDSGVLLLKGESISRIEQKDGLISNHVPALLQDREANIWLATGGGLQKYGGGRYSNYYLPEMQEIKGAKKLCNASNGDLWIGTWGRGLYRFDGKQYHNYTSEEGLSHNNILGIVEDNRQQIWIATNRGLTRWSYETQQFETWFKADGLPQDVLISIDTDRHGNVWIGTFTEGLVKFDGQTFTTYNTENGLIHNAVWDIELDELDRVWCATDGGFSVLSGNTFTNYSTANGLPRDAGLLVKKGPDGNMWLGLDEGGVALLKTDVQPAAFELFNMNHGLYNNSVVAMEFDARGNLWIGTSRGVDRLDVKEWKSTGQKQFQHYDRSDGFLGVECNQNGIVRGRNGAMWFGTIKGAVHYNPAFDVSNPNEPQTHVTAIDLHFNQVDWATLADSTSAQFGLPVNVELPYNKNHLTFHFSAISLTVPERVRYQYRLAGFDDGWTPETENREATYSNLPPGSYTFEVKACNNDGVWNQLPTTVSFTIRAPFWQTWWFYSLCALLIVAGFFTYVTLRTRALRQAKERLQVMVKQATHEIVAQRDEIALKNKDITDSIEYAKTLQEAILPTVETLQSGLGNHFVLYRPRDIVSGDFYWIYEREGLVYFAAADCTGHGVPGAFVSIMGNNMLNQVVIEEGNTDPGRILSELNRKVCYAFQQQGAGRSARDGMDIAFCVIDRAQQQLRFAGAMNGLVLVRNGEAMEIAAERNPIGGRTPLTFEFATQTVPYQAKDALYMFSDGYPDQFGGPKGKKFMTRKLRSLLAEIAAWEPALQLTHLEETFAQWKGEYNQVDDVLVVGVRL